MNMMAQPTAAMPFASLVARREAALAAERLHDKTIGFETPEAAAESDRLADVRDKAEDMLMATPSPDASAFAYKYLVAFGDGREADCWRDMIEREATLFAASQLHTSAAWRKALTDYEAKRKEWNRLAAADSPDCPAACEACMEAIDRLDDTRAPNAEAAVFKIELAKERWSEFSMPDEVMDAIAADIRHLSPAPIDPHMGWLAQRDAVWSEYNSYMDDDDTRDEPLVAAGRELEQRILETPAATRDGILAKALLIIGAACVPGATPDEQAVFDEAKAMGLVEWEA